MEKELKNGYQMVYTSINSGSEYNMYTRLGPWLGHMLRFAFECFRVREMFAFVVCMGGMGVRCKYYNITYYFRAIRYGSTNVPCLESILNIALEMFE